VSVISQISRSPVNLAPAPVTPPPPVPLTAMSDIAAGLGHIERSVPLGGEDPDVPRSMRLIATPDYDVWLITWPPGARIGAHDHAGATSVIRVVQGALVEIVDRQHRVLEPGVSVVSAPYTPHQIHNPAPVEATSVHVYSPPLAAVTYLDPSPGKALHPAQGDRRPRSTPVRPRPAEATSD